jgi:flagellar basal body L-ring protein FlgH
VTKRLILFCATFLFLKGCASWFNDSHSEESNSAVVQGPATHAEAGDDRSPAAVKKKRAITLDSGGVGSYEAWVGTSDPSGPDLTRNEFGAAQRFGGDSTVKAQRRSADPWYGVNNPTEGSLWNDTTNDNFYFAKNVSRKVGDLLVVKLESDLNDSLNNKIAAFIEKNTPKPSPAEVAALAAIQKGAAEAKLDPNKKPASLEETAKKAGDAAKVAGVNSAIDAAAQAATDAIAKKNERFVDVDEMTVRIVQSLARGAFRVEGTRRINIRNAPYAIKLAGVVRNEDILPTSEVSSAKVLDSKLELTR